MNPISSAPSSILSGPVGTFDAAGDDWSAITALSAGDGSLGFIADDMVFAVSNPAPALRPDGILSQSVRTIMSAITVMLLLSCAAFAADVDIQAHPSGIWSVADTKKARRWIVIHNLAEAKTSGVYHIELIQRAFKAPSWQIERVAKHMAITEAALQRSIVKPLDKGLVYPEAFDTALAQWRAENGGSGGAVCTTSVLQCLSP